MHRQIVLQALYMACCEMEYLLDLDTQHYVQHAPKLIWYYGQVDGWVTSHHAQDIKAALPQSKHIHCQHVRARENHRERECVCVWKK